MQWHYLMASKIGSMKQQCNLFSINLAHFQTKVVVSGAFGFCQSHSIKNYPGGVATSK